MSDAPRYCGSRTTMGHGETAICGVEFYGEVHQCNACRVAELEREVVGLMEEQRKGSQIIARLHSEVAELRNALEAVANTSSHYGPGPHCTCSQGAREALARAALNRSNSKVEEA